MGNITLEDTLRNKEIRPPPGCHPQEVTLRNKTATPLYTAGVAVKLKEEY
jgi:hypothetical protein